MISYKIVRISVGFVSRFYGDSSPFLITIRTEINKEDFCYEYFKC